VTSVVSRTCGPEGTPPRPRNVRARALPMQRNRDGAVAARRTFAMMPVFAGPAPCRTAWP